MKDRISGDLYVYVRDMCGIVKVLDGQRYLVKSTGEVLYFDKTGIDRT